MIGYTLATKQRQTQLFDESGKRIPVTQLGVTSCYVVDIKTKEKNGYDAIKVAFDERKSIGKPEEGELKKSGIEKKLGVMSEFRLDKAKPFITIEEKEGKMSITFNDITLSVGDEIKPNILFQPGDMVDVHGASKGKGFQGVVKRYNFRGGPRTRGQSDRERAPGSVGQSTPGRILKGKKLPGQMGAKQVTAQNLKVIQVDETSIVVKGQVPGYKNAIVKINTHIQ